MRALVIYCHPNPESFTAAVKDRILEKLSGNAAETRVVDLYGEGFQPVLSPEEHATYLEPRPEDDPVGAHIENIQWCDTLIFVYPTWWYGLPAVLKGWLDRVLLPDIAFLMPDETHKSIRPGLKHIKRLAVFTSGGASRWLMFLIGAPGRRTIFRGIGFLCAKPLKKCFVAHYEMDGSTPQSRQAHLDRVDKAMERILA